jgi:hypothetical protein
MNVKRWKELRDMEENNPEELERIGREVAVQVGIIFAKDKLTAMDVMICENKRDHPETMQRITEWF